MENSKIAVGLDIGTTKIVAMIGRKNEHGKVEVLGIGKAKSVGVKRGVVSNITQTMESIKEAVREAENISGCKIQNVVVGVAGEHIHSLHHSDYIIRQNAEDVIVEDDIEELIKQVRRLAMMPGDEIIHVLPQEYKIDGQKDISEPIGMYGSRLEANFHVVVGKTASIKNIIRCVKMADLELSHITLESLASSFAVLDEEEKEVGVALVDIGGGTTDLAIFKDGTIRHTAVIEAGGNIITEDIKEACFITDKQSELLKVRFGSAWPGENKETDIVAIPGLRDREPKEVNLKDLSKCIHARVEEIIKLVHKQIVSYDGGNNKKRLIGGIVLTGGGSQLKHIRQLVEFITGMDTRIGYANEHVAGDSKDEVINPSYATAVGLLMQGLEIAENTCLNNSLEQQKMEDEIERMNNAVKQEEEKIVEEQEPVEEVVPQKVEVKKPKSKFSLQNISEALSKSFTDLLERGE